MNLMFHSGLPSFGGSFVFLDMGFSSFVFLDMGFSFFVPCIPPLFGCFDLFMIDNVSSLMLELPRPTICS